MQIRLATQAEADAIVALRKTAYQTATGSVIASFSFLEWSQEDEDSLILILEDSSRNIISTMRGKLLASKEELDAFFDISSDPALKFPVFTMGRAATRLDYRRQGFSAIFRMLFLEACQNSVINHIVATIQEDASRVPLLREMGYRVEPADLSNRTGDYFQNTSTALVAYLHAGSFPKALEVSKKKIQNKLASFTFAPDLLDSMRSKMKEQAEAIKVVGL